MLQPLTRFIAFAILVIMPAMITFADQPLRVGVATVDITPPTGYRMSGYFRERLNTGTHDPLVAKAMVFSQGETSVAIVCCDLIGISPQVSSKARAQASKLTGIAAENMTITATHSHTGPLYFGAMRNYFHARAKGANGGRDPHEEIDYADWLAKQLSRCIASAHESLAERSLRAGTAEQLGLSFNRRFHMRDGSVRFNPGVNNPDIVRVAGPIDPEVGLLAVTDSNGEPLAALTVFALHLDTVGGTEYSADYPYYVSNVLQQRYGKEFVSLFGAGTCGDINHVDVTRRERRSAEEIGTTLGTTVADALPKLAPQTPSLAVRRSVVEVPLQQYSAEQTASARRDLAKIGTRELSFLEQVETYKIVAVDERRSDTIGLEVHAIRLSSDTAMVTLPGEVFVDLGLAIKQASPFKQTLVIELANDAPGYLPTEKAFAEGSYETINSRIKTGGAEQMATAAIDLLKELAASR